MREPGPRPSWGPGWRPGPGPQPWAGNFIRKPAASPGLGGTCPHPSTRARVGKVALGARDGLGATRILWFSCPPRSGPVAARPPPTDSNLPPGPCARRPERAPGRTCGKCNFLLRPGVAAPGSTWPRDDLAVRAAARAGRARGDGRFPGGSGCGRPSSRGREGRLANFAELSPPAGRSRPVAGAAPAPPAEGGCGSLSAPSRPPGRRRLPCYLGSPRGFAPCGRRGSCLPGRWVAPRSGWSFSRRSLRAVAN